MSSRQKDYTIAAYQHHDFSQVVSLLGRVLHCEPITEASFAYKVLLDPNFDPNGALVARDPAGIVVGFLFALIRRIPLEDAPSDKERGWITLFAVAERARRQGVGTALLVTAENWLRSHSRSEVWISSYAPNYWTPGVDEAAYAEGLAFLQQHGYTTVYRPLSMDATLVGWKSPAWLHQKELRQQWKHVLPRRFTPADTSRMLSFLREEFPGDWQRYIREAMQDMAVGKRPCDELRFLLHEENVVGFAHSEGERFGPFGVAKAWRGKGMGARLLYSTLESMRNRGLHTAWFLWTDDATAERLYKPAGFRETRRYAVLCKKLN